jgi:hypothetical protein
MKPCRKIVISFIRNTLISLSVFYSMTCFAQHKIQINRNANKPYIIIIDPQAPGSVKTAAADMQRCFEQSVGAHLEIKTTTQTPASPYISLGVTAASGKYISANGRAETAAINDGFRIITIGENIFILGRDTPDGKTDDLGGVLHGTANGVYTFLEDYLGVRWVMAGHLGEIVPRRQQIDLPAIDRTVIPPFVYRNLVIGGNSDDELWKLHQKVIKVADVQHSHSWEQTIPTSAYETHPDWFAQINGRSIPPSARYKFKTTNPELINAFADTVIAAFRRDPNKKYYSLSPSDGGGWSTDPESMALYEKDPNGKTSLTTLVLKFYNDVAKIVRKVYPDRKVAGYIYADYLYPPAGAMPKLEPNLSLVIANSLSYGFTLYRPSVKKEWEKVMSKWAVVAKDGVDLYYYDLPTMLKQDIGIITPPAPDMLNFIYSRLAQYGFKGVFMNGRSIWAASSANNYLIAKLMWDPTADANHLLIDFYNNAYGAAAAPYISELYQIVEKSFIDYYNRHPDASFNLTWPYFTEIYGPQYLAMEALYLKAWQATNDTKCKARLELLGHVFSLLQFTLHNNSLLPAGYKSPLTINDAQADEYFGAKSANDIYNVGGVRDAANDFNGITVHLQPPLKRTSAKPFKPVTVPFKSLAKAVLYATGNGQVRITFSGVNTQGEFNTFMVDDSKGREVVAGVITEGRAVNFKSDSGKVYYLAVNNDWSAYKITIQGAEVAYKADPQYRGIRLQPQKIEEELPFYFYVPAGIKSFYLLINGYGVVADVISPDGVHAGTISTEKDSPQRINIREDMVQAGFWQLRIHAAVKSGDVYFVLDPKLPQWLSTNPDYPLIVTQSAKSVKNKKNR